MTEHVENSGPFGFLPREQKKLHAFLADLRENKPVTQLEPLGIWAVTRYDDVVHVLKHHEIFSSGALQSMGMIEGDAEKSQSEIALSSDNASLLFRITPTVITSDPPVHGQLRNIVNRGFTPSQIEKVEARIREIANDLLDKIVGEGEFELVQEYAVPLPIIVIAQLLGVEPDRREDFKRWSDDFIANLGQTPDEETLGRIEVSAQEFANFFGEVIAARRKAPKDDLISIIVHSETSEGRLNDVQILAFCRLLLIAGNETTTNLISRMTQTLLDHPEQLQKLRNDPSLIPNAVEETLRYAGIVPTLPRLSMQDSEVGGVTISAGQLVMPFFMAANRDPRRFPDPDTFDVTRKTTGHLGFGFGAHFCLGSHLARLETRIAIEGMIQRLPNFRITRLSDAPLGLVGVPDEIHMAFDA